MGDTLGSDRKSFLRSMPKAGGSAVLVAMLAAAIPFGSAGCFLPILGAIPSVISLAHAAYTAGSKDDADAKAQDPEPTEEASKPPPQLTPGSVCQMMAITHPDTVLVELRKKQRNRPGRLDSGGELSQDELPAAADKLNSRRGVLLSRVCTNRDGPERSVPGRGTQVGYCKWGGHVLLGRTSLSIHGSAHPALPFSFFVAICRIALPLTAAMKLNSPSIAGCGRLRKRAITNPAL